jgi:hypothetical protein
VDPGDTQGEFVDGIGLWWPPDDSGDQGLLPAGDEVS